MPGQEKWDGLLSTWLANLSEKKYLVHVDSAKGYPPLRNMNAGLIDVPQWHVFVVPIWDVLPCNDQGRRIVMPYLELNGHQVARAS
jgi:hypothetical protein